MMAAQISLSVLLQLSVFPQKHCCHAASCIVEITQHTLVAVVAESIIAIDLPPVPRTVEAYSTVLCAIYTM